MNSKSNLYVPAVIFAEQKKTLRFCMGDEHNGT